MPNNQAILIFFFKYRDVNNVNAKSQSKHQKNKDSYIMWFENVESLTSYLTRFLK